MSSKTVKVKARTQPLVVMEAEVARKIRQHSRTSMKTEVCGVLIGTADDDRTLIDACIPGINAAQGGAHVTFTQDTWEHIYKIKDEQFPEKKIVGWYHSHPGFGVFLSEHDLFIQENFFSSPQQVAWVYDPHTDEEGCFGWISGKTEKLNGVRFGYSQAVDVNGSTISEYDDGGGEPLDSMIKVPGDNAAPDRDPAWARWTSWGLISLALLAAGFVLGYEYIARQVRELEPALAMCQQIVGNPIQACRVILQDAGIATLPPSELQSPLQPSQPSNATQTAPAQAAPAKQTPTPRTKEQNGKH